MSPERQSTRAYRAARDQLLVLRDDYAAARQHFRWPQIADFNWARDWFDQIALANDRPALRIVTDTAVRDISFAELSRRSTLTASQLGRHGLQQGDYVLVCLGPTLHLWEVMLGIMKLGAVAVPIPQGLSAADVGRRAERISAVAVIGTADGTHWDSDLPAGVLRITPDDEPGGSTQWRPLSAGTERFAHALGAAGGGDPLMGYFTSGTTASPKFVEHSHVSYPIGHLSSLYASGLVQGDIHVNIASPGWAKHSWSSFFVPWTAEATVVVSELPSQPDRIDVEALISVLKRTRATSLCAPPAVWRALGKVDTVGQDLCLREATSAGEALGLDTFTAVHNRWGISVRDVYGQTETTAILANLPGRTKPGTSGLPLPGYDVVLVDPDGRPADDGELCIRVDTDFPAIMRSYPDRPPGGSGLYRTGDIGRRDAEGFITILGRVDDMFKCEGHRVGPVEIESVLASHPSIVEVAIAAVGTPPVGTTPHAFVRLRGDIEADEMAARSIFAHTAAQLSPHARPSRIHFVSSLPRTASGKVRRNALRSELPSAGIWFDETEVPP